MTTTASIEPRTRRNGRSNGRVEHLSVAERGASGKAARSQVPRGANAQWTPAASGRDPVGLLESQARTRVPDLVPIRYRRMLVSPFTFFRGAAAIMAADLEAEARTGLQVQLCGDAHLSNFGAFAAPDRRMVFSINDFDETLPGPFEWDVKRLVASFAVAGRALGFDAAQRRVIDVGVTRAYRDAMASFAAMRTMDLWYTRLDVADIATALSSSTKGRDRKRFRRNVEKAQTKDSLRAFAKLAHIVDGERRIVSDPPLIVPIEDALPEPERSRSDAFMHGVIRAYRRTLPGDRRQLLERFRYAHAARKVVGVGSFGTRAWIILLLGRDDDDPLLLQAKEAEASVLEPALGPSAFANHGQRVVEGQRLIQATSDVMLGWLRIEDQSGVKRDFYLRQLWDQKGSALIEKMSPRSMMVVYANVCGWSLARAHARSGDAVAIASYLGRGASSDEALAEFAETYADQNERDYDALSSAASLGRVEAATGR